MSKKQIKVLLVEDNLADARLVNEMLIESGQDNFNFRTVGRLSSALNLLNQEKFDILLLDLNLPDAHGLSGLIEVQTLMPDLPIVVRSGFDDEQLALDAVQSGAQDYLVKGQESGPLLTRALRYAIERKCSEQRLAYLAHYDPLTDLPNRVLFRERLNRAQHRANRHASMIALLFLDLDHFKDINDTLGHDAGDQLLQVVAKRLKNCVRAEDSIAHLGGDEFTIILEDIAHKQDAANIAQKIVEEMAEAFLLNGKDVFVSASIGIAIYPGDGQSPELLIKHADMALYAAKEKGRGNYQFFEEKFNRAVAKRLAMVTFLQHALERDEFVLHYQPQIDPLTKKLLGLEALLRWQHPELGLVLPKDFIHLLEETGLIFSVGEWVLNAVCKQSSIWQAAGLPPTQIAINLSARQFQQVQLAKIIKKILDETGMDPHNLQLEVTESLLISNAEKTISTLCELRDTGIHIVMDDFGTGYSSLNYLHRYPFDTLKIDRSFVQDISGNAETSAIIPAIIALAHSLGLKVIAEGVENEQQLSFLLNLKCEAVQGFLFATPMPSEQCGAWIKNHQEFKEHHTLNAVC